eukprot:6946252-Alexandrium_andersonii.AAC.1
MIHHPRTPHCASSVAHLHLPHAPCACQQSPWPASAGKRGAWCRHACHCCLWPAQPRMEMNANLQGWREVRTYMGMFGGSSLKATLLYGSQDAVP